MPIIPGVTGTIVCGVCGTVNVGVFARCIACGQDLPGAARKPDAPADADAPSAARDSTGPVTGGRRKSSHAMEADDELDSASYRQTVVEPPKLRETVQIKVDPQA